MRKRRVTDKRSKKCRKIGVWSYQRDNFSYARDKLSVAGQTISNSIFTTPQDFGLGEFFYVFFNKIMVYFVIGKRSILLYAKTRWIGGEEWHFKQKDYVSIVEKSIQKAVCYDICRRAKREVQSLLRKRKKKMSIFSGCYYWQISKRLLVNCGSKREYYAKGTGCVYP